MLLAVLGTWEVIIILAVILLMFGPSKLPALGEGIGKMLRGFKREMGQVEADRKAPAAPHEIDVTPREPIGGKSE